MEESVNSTLKTVHTAATLCCAASCYNITGSNIFKYGAWPSIFISSPSSNSCCQIHKKICMWLDDIIRGNLFYCIMKRVGEGRKVVMIMLNNWLKWDGLHTINNEIVD